MFELLQVCSVLVHLNFRLQSIALCNRRSNLSALSLEPNTIIYLPTHTSGLFTLDCEMGRPCWRREERCLLPCNGGRRRLISPSRCPRRLELRLIGAASSVSSLRFFLLVRSESLCFYFGQGTMDVIIFIYLQITRVVYNFSVFPLYLTMQKFYKILKQF